MKTPLLGQKIAVLVANGFCEKDLTRTQKALRDSGADMRIISMDQGLVHSWIDDSWGWNYAPDQVLSRALAADYDMLIVPGGRRSIEKLELTAHTRRFIGGFVDCAKPVAFYHEALELLLVSERIRDIPVAGPESLQELAQEHGFEWFDGPCVISGHVITGFSDEGSREEYAQKVAAFLIEKTQEETQAESEKENARQLVAA